jgi:hypothetical protein
MSNTITVAYRILALSLALTIPACDGSDPQSPASSSTSTRSISGTVVFDQTGSPAEGVDVTLESWAGSGMMMGDHWNQTQHMVTNSHGQFHFDYQHEPMHRYRVGVRDRNDWHMCDWDASDIDTVLLVIPAPNP